MRGIFFGIFYFMSGFTFFGLTPHFLFAQPEEAHQSISIQTAVNAANLPMATSAHEQTSRLAENRDTQRIRAIISEYVYTSQDKLRDRFIKMKDLKVPVARKRMIKLADRFLELVQEAEAKINDPEAKKSKRTVPIILREALWTYEEAVLQSYRLKWTYFSLRSYIIDEIEDKAEVASSATLSGTTAGFAVAAVLTDPIFVGALSSVLSYFVDPTNTLGAALSGAGGGTLAKLLGKREVRYAISTAIGFITIPIVRQLEVWRWKKQNPNPAVPPYVAFNAFWDRIKSFKYPLPDKADDKISWVQEKLERTLGDPICHFALAPPPLP